MIPPVRKATEQCEMPTHASVSIKMLQSAISGAGSLTKDLPKVAQQESASSRPGTLET